MRFSKHTGADRDGQIMPLFGLFVIVLILMVGIGIDLGFAYITKAELSKAVDAACLAGLAHLSEGDTSAANMAKSTFLANYGHPGRDTGTITPTVTFGTTAGGNRTVSVSATTEINTYFVRVLPQWKKMNVSDDAQAIRANAIITLVIDRSQSMDRNCVNGPCAGCSDGAIYLPNAVKKFIARFDDNVDQAALVSFASSVRTDKAMGRPFKNTITAATTESAVLWEGGTFAQGGLTNGLAINNAVAVPNGQTALKVIVFFTDGQPNMIQDRLTCPDGTSKPWNFGGNPCANGAVSIFATNAPVTQCGQGVPSYATTGGNGGSCPSYPTRCNGAGDKYPSVSGRNETLTMPHVWLDASNRCVRVANEARAAGMYVYAIGLDTDGLGTPQKTFLNLVANDPQSPAFDRNLPVGIAFNVGNGSDLEAAFQQVAADILLRLIE